MAELTTLDQVVVAFARVLQDAGAPFDTATHYGPPLEAATAVAEEVRVTLLWVTPQPTHRNDAWDRTATGQLKPPPLTLSAFVLVTTYGGGDVDPASAYELLGRALATFHDRPTVTLPMASLPAIGDGELTFVQVPTAADLMEKVFSPLQLRHRPWALFEVAPVQLVSGRPRRDAGPPVLPGRIGIDVAVAARPAIRRIAPAHQVRGGALRLELDLQGRPLAEVQIDGRPAPHTAIDADAGLFLVDVPAAASLGDAPVIVRTGTPLAPPIAWSAPETIEVLGATSPAIEALDLEPVPAGGLLTITGQSLAAASHVAIWPDAGVRSPSSLAEIPVTSAGAGAVTVAGAALQPALDAAGLRGLAVRVVVRVAPRAYTPFIVTRFA